jgi:hypothetical protein
LHGPRTAAVGAYAKNGAAAPELMGMLCWSNLRTSQSYFEKVEKRRKRAISIERSTVCEKQKSVSIRAAKKPNDTN